MLFFPPLFPLSSSFSSLLLSSRLTKSCSTPKSLDKLDLFLLISGRVISSILPIFELFPLPLKRIFSKFNSSILLFAKSKTKFSASNDKTNSPFRSLLLLLLKLSPFKLSDEFIEINSVNKEFFFSPLFLLTNVLQLFLFSVSFLPSLNYF
ncbi:hypothetical protein [Cryptosporidium parvum Iowa II]|uniref:Uncharacterized protein n=2 Tax=Cryptosporidium parvum TaxID=5807 RepID=Q5CWB0_CRYPI|nr:hypothetical protein [Cryptosporidium parvum Iowa II]EAK89325.1 hypothetical protein cgd8_1010 [Cryptosporidium parvum Iowa II]QOY39852.1 Uncharacterized protein CPATCC_0001060 [Cryptosporidium parvum]WKS79350.1 hypothetical protein CPCDC_8g1010 [Cryptosporidium sp. 43IA8]|eukprot:QOY39852.1 hypothetical protein CPATCC_003906 [Cryptosporidium parvum]